MKKKAQATIFALLLAAAAAVGPVRAQYSPYSYLYMGQSLLYPLTRTLGSGLMYGPYNSNPFYSTSSYLRGMNSRAIQWPYIYGYGNNTYGQYGYRNGSIFNQFGNNQNQNQNPNPTAADEPDNANPGGNTMNSTNPYQTQAQPQTPGQGSLNGQANLPPLVVPSSGGAPAASAPGTSYGAFGTSAGGGFAPTNSNVPPPVAPGPKGKRSKHVKAPKPTQSSSQAAPAQSAQSAQSGPVQMSPVQSAAGAAPQAMAKGGMQGPLAAGFINHINANYQGDMSRALSNSDTRSWAKAMGVIEPDVIDTSHLSGDRLEVINRMLKDNSLDPMAKLETMRILLRKSPAASP